ncbi:MAG: acyl carrier protein, partial [Lachnospiraceae bacterium]|nr:acyl carrier protein [Lachnospiraceae bacterium]
MFETVKEIIIDILSCPADKITLEADLFKDLGADSLDAVELTLAVEEKT